MARNRQRAKERQARRRAQQGDGKDGLESARKKPEPVEPDVVEPEAEPSRVEAEAARAEPVEPEPVEPEPIAPEPDEPKPVTPEEVELRAGAPPEELGRSDEVLEDEPDLDELDEEELHYDPDEDDPEEEVAPTTRGPRGRRGDDAEAKHKDRPRFVQFLFAVVAELRRVQWPDRQATTTLTGVVLGFVLIAGGYLGLLDAIFSRIIQAIL